MSALSIRAYFPFCRVRLVRQSVSAESGLAWIEAEPDRRYRPKCAGCGAQARKIHQYHDRVVRDLDMGSTEVHIHCRYRTVRCDGCGGYSVEDLEAASRVSA